ncbi:helix-turn-helix domain-containing protein, partial [Klebsiella quasipneumoniae]
MTGISNFALSFAYRERFSDYENSFIFQSELDHKMDKKLRVAEIAARTGLSASTVSRVLAGKANTSDKARRAVL